ncbi:MAG: hypothetical protein LKJ59_01570 [Oscillospiraceae bacterium]|jgi:hypothetical protein|nr:hypothetical protein [Oscillospiraceae bacterium]MCI2034817.1 hypothetical protein [Oscillospiraceae bacterium]
MFADYAFYTSSYGGSVLSEASFPSYANRATAYLDSIMPAVPDPAPDELKMAMCAVADEMLKDAAGQAGIQSENTDGYSVTYVTPLSAKRRYYDLAAQFLAGTDLMGRWI